MKLLVQPEAAMTPLIQAIARARKTIDIAIFRLDRKEVEQALASAVARGVIVRALVAHRNSGSEDRLRKLEQRLLERGIGVSRTGDDLLKYHGKYMVVDDSLHVLGFNLTKADALKSRSFGIATRNKRAVADARALFESDLTRQTYAGAATSPLVVSPETSRAALQRFVSGARRHLAIYDARLLDRQFLKLLQDQSAAGVRIQIIGRTAKLPPEVQVRALKGLRLHVRAIVRDGTRAFVGSQSLRPLELDRRREVGLIITNPAVARRMLTVFDQDWERAGHV